ncbi:hypothetical protein PCLA_12r0153 [Pseudomonas citronellolis]|nr:hypothetical protein PCLA_12r0153 [Pseudomonas citronellolis]
MVDRGRRETLFEDRHMDTLWLIVSSLFLAARRRVGRLMGRFIAMPR